MLSHDGRTAMAVEDSSTLAVLSLAEPERPIVRLTHSRATARNGATAVSPDGRWAASLTWSGRGLRVWDTASGRLVRDLWPENRGGCAAFSPRGRWLAATSNEELRLWQFSDLRLTKSVPREARVNTSGPVAFSPDERILAAAMTRSGVQLFNPVDGSRLLTIDPPDVSYEVTYFAFSPDGRHLAICYSDSVDVWDLALVHEQLQGAGLDWTEPASDHDSIQLSLRADTSKPASAD